CVAFNAPVAEPHDLTVCKVILDAEGNVIPHEDWDTLADFEFSIPVHEGDANNLPLGDEVGTATFTNDSPEDCVTFTVAVNIGDEQVDYSYAPELGASAPDW